MNYRKDASPQETIEKITKILNNMCIEFVITNEMSYKDLWWSLKVELCNHPNICSNGKGCTRSLALASGLAEFMERLQSGMLIESFKVPKQTGFYNILSRRRCCISNEIIKIMCGTNGLAAGNTFHEAACQGFFEVIERYVVKQFFLNPHEKQLGCFDKSQFFETDAYQTLKEIEKRGLLTYIIDGTCGGKFPALGLVVFNPKSHAYLINFASDFDINICLNRCITELFQGRRIHDLLNENSLCLNCVFDNVDFDETIEFYKQIMISNGSLTSSALYNILSNIAPNSNLNVFTKVNTNEECYRLIELFCKQKKMEVYIGNLSFTDFYTCRVYIPGYSEVYEDNIKSAHRMKDCILNLRKIIKGYVNTEYSINDLKCALIDLLPFKVYLFYLPFCRLIPQDTILHPELVSGDIMHVLSIICLYQRDIDSAIMYAKKSLKIYNKNHIHFLLWYLNIKKIIGEKPITYWHDENDGITQSIDEFENIYNNSVKLLYLNSDEDAIK